MSNTAKKSKFAKDVAWKFVTNHLNMALISTIGMIPSTQQLGKKYYNDSLAWFDGYIPLFAQTSQEVWQEAINEDPNTLKPCIVSFTKTLIDTLSENTSTLPVFGQGGWRLANIKADDISDVVVLLAPAPISLSFVDKLIFKDKTDEQVFIDRITDSMNALHRTCKVSASEFNKKTHLPIEQLKNLGLFEELPPLTGGHYDFANIAVAIINHLMILSPTNKSAWQLLSYLKNVNVLSEHPYTNTLIDIGEWIKTLGQYQAQTSTAGVFLQILNALITQKYNGAFASSKDIVLATLHELSQGNSQSQYFVDDLMNFLSLSSFTTDDLLTRYTKPLQRAVILFISRDDVIDLWQKHGIDNKEDLNETDILLATLLFATSKGWQALPKPFKEYANQTLISEELLAKIAQGVSLTYLQDTIEKFTTPLSGVWQPTPTTLMKKRLLAFIAQQGWECAFDIISLPSEVQFSVKGSKLTTKAKVGSIKIDTHIDYDIFWQQMAQLDWVNFKMDKQLQKTKITS